MTYFVVILIKNCTSLASTSLLIICDKTSAKKRWSLSKIVFLIVETTFRHTYPSSELRCLPRSDPRNLCARIRLLATGNSFINDVWLRYRTLRTERLPIFWLVFFGEVRKRDANFLSQDHGPVLGLSLSQSEILFDWKWNLVNFCGKRIR